MPPRTRRLSTLEAPSPVHVDSAHGTNDWLSTEPVCGQSFDKKIFGWIVAADLLTFFIPEMEVTLLCCAKSLQGEAPSSSAVQKYSYEAGPKSLCRA